MKCRRKQTNFFTDNEMFSGVSINDNVTEVDLNNILKDYIIQISLI